MSSPNTPDVSRRDSTSVSTGLIVVTTALLIALDQSSKFFAVRSNSAHQNPAAILSLPIPNPVLIAIGVVILALLTYTARQTKQHNPYLSFSLLLVIIGGISNLLDRIIIGSVVDILAISSLNLNLADIYIAVGTLSALISLTYRRKIS